MLDVLNVIVVGAIAAVLPAPERDRLAERYDVDVPLFSFMIGAIEAPGGILAFMAGGIASVWGASGSNGRLLIENWWPGLSTVHFQGLGLLAWLSWLLHPAAWLFLLVAATGLVRLVAFSVTRTAVAEPLAAVSCALVRLTMQKAVAARRAQMLGAWRPDRFVREPGSDLVVLTCREKPGWNELATMEIDGAFYRLIDVSLRPEGNRRALAYRLRRAEPHGVIRRLVRYEPTRDGG